MEEADNIILALKKEVEDPLPSTSDSGNDDVALKEEIFEENSNSLEVRIKQELLDEQPYFYGELINVKEENEMMIVDGDNISNFTLKEDVDFLSPKSEFHEKFAGRKMVGICDLGSVDILSVPGTRKRSERSVRSISFHGGRSTFCLVKILVGDLFMIFREEELEKTKEDRVVFVVHRGMKSCALIVLPGDSEEELAKIKEHFEIYEKLFFKHKQVLKCQSPKTQREGSEPLTLTEMIEYVVGVDVPDVSSQPEDPTPGSPSITGQKRVAERLIPSDRPDAPHMSQSHQKISQLDNLSSVENPNQIEEVRNLNRFIIGHHTEEKSHQCPLCEYEVAQPGSLKKHIKTHHKRKKFHQCPHCEYKAIQAGNLKVHIMNHTGEKPYQCPHCDYKAVNASILKAHIMTHTGEKPHQCPHCEYKAVKVGNLKAHIMTHTGEKPHKCPHCEYKAILTSTLKKHIMVHHTGEKPHQCPHCEYRAIITNTLKKHIMANHTGEKPHQCPHCKYKAVKTSNLKVHIMTHTGEKPYQCPYCEYKAVSIGNLKKHIMVHHTREKPHQCPHCVYRTVTTVRLKRHIMAHHTKKKKLSPTL